MTGSASVDADAEEATEGQSLSELVYTFLSDQRRRYILHYLKQTGGTVTTRELAEQVAAWENNKSIDELESQERKRVYISLYQSHLPSLDRAGVIDYDADRGTVELADRLAHADIYMEVVSERNVPWSLFYFGLAAANGLLVFLTWLQIRPFGSIPGIGLAALIVLSFGASAVVQAMQDRRMKFGDQGGPPGSDS